MHFSLRNDFFFWGFGVRVVLYAYENTVIIYVSGNNLSVKVIVQPDPVRKSVKIHPGTKFCPGTMTAEKAPLNTDLP